MQIKIIIKKTGKLQINLVNKRNFSFKLLQLKFSIRGFGVSYKPMAGKFVLNNFFKVAKISYLSIAIYIQQNWVLNYICLFSTLISKSVVIPVTRLAVLALWTKIV